MFTSVPPPGLGHALRGSSLSPAAGNELFRHVENVQTGSAPTYPAKSLVVMLNFLGGVYFNIIQYFGTPILS